jgi:CRP/FNR family cyclic AMP-dependent transcriptional regulator
MIERFEGNAGQRRLLEALRNQSLVEHNDYLAQRLCDAGTLEKFEAGSSIITQGASDNDVYFILAGEAEVLVNGRQVALRKAQDAIGEMTLLNPASARSATLRAITEVVALKVSEPDFQEIAEDFPRVWKTVATVINQRLRQRGDLLNSPNRLPMLFIGCSTESLNIAREIQSGLKYDKVEAIIWTDYVFGPSSVPVDALLETARTSDFAAFVFGPDDKVTSRAEEYNAPRDNSVFELGLFMGQLDRHRTFIIKEQSLDIKIPTDLLGITPISYVDHGSTNLTATLGSVCSDLRKKVSDLGCR